jgi:predicted transcriptional regulator of viral defense system
MPELAGLGKSSRQKLSRLSRAFKDAPFSVAQALPILELNKEQTSRFLTALANHGWAKRLKRGHYFLVPIEASDPEPVADDPWFVAANIFSPCYISGWSAAEHWGFTEQIFKSVYVITSKKLKKRAQTLGGADFVIKTTKTNLIFGSTTVWKGKVKALVADPTKLIIDLLDSPESGGGIGHVIQILKAYLKSTHRSPEKLLKYAIKQSNGAVIKRLGYLLEKLAPEEIKTISELKNLISKGYSKLDPNLKSKKIITRWRIWIPDYIEKDFSND